MNVGRNGDERHNEMEQNGQRLQQTTLAMVLQSDPHPRTLQRWRVEEKKEFFFLFRVFLFFFILFFFFLFQSCYKGYSLHDCKLKNT